MSIQLNLGGLSFCIFNPSLSCIESIYHLSLPPTMPLLVVEKELQDYLKNERALCQDFDTIKVIHNNQDFAFVPEKLFASEHLFEYLKFNVQEYRNQIISHDTLEQEGMINVYIPNASVNRILRETYGIFEYEHFTTLLLKVLLMHNPQKKPAVYAHFEKGCFHLVIFKEGKVAFFNYFTFEEPIDMLYYLLFSLEQVSMDTEVTPIYLLGDIIRNSEEYYLIYKYVRFIYFLPPQKSNPFCQNMDPTLARMNFILTHTF